MKELFLLKRTNYFRFNFLMEEKSTRRVRIHEQDELQNDAASDLSASVNPQKYLPRSKKETLRQKKRGKALESKGAHLEDQDTDHFSVKNKSDEDRSTTSQENAEKLFRESWERKSGKAADLLGALLNKPPYLSLANSNRIVGYFGHASAIFKRPIIEGSFFLQFTVLEDAKKEKKVSFPSAVRVGVCVHDFNPVFPLGCKESIAYKSSDGSIIRQSEKIGQAEPYSVGDVMGVCLRMRPLQKFRQPGQISEGSSVSFYKNGKLVFQFKELRQVFYSLGVSCFNYAQVEVGVKEEPRYRMGQSQHYFKVLKEKILYKELEGNRLFKI